MRDSSRVLGILERARRARRRQACAAPRGTIGERPGARTKEERRGGKEEGRGIMRGAELVERARGFAPVVPSGACERSQLVGRRPEGTPTYRVMEIEGCVGRAIL